eukprot:CAMPEP_0182915580 /NCGR_PEP_ID=MMETSP0105_2-20130417/396_1 /TAXON_ID=81532 ORGANISM="Acanthoeca-like sp., Strain 10tr" /NCGR_SAMPLE_ID=MMETSP0105_2 /ASSEMBLY_ACC=CAM_ASM_000205 /LENGTH=445 /DNA_ID=CAMNT_0025052451 /DNA_START=115 /DNA_END=1452 /DNA_ORIENTATION=+
MMKSIVIAAVAATATADIYTWRGPAVTFNSDNVWFGASLSQSARSVQYGTSGTEQVVSGLSGTAEIGSGITFYGRSSIEFTAAGTLEFTSNPTSEDATWMQLQSGFNTPTASSTTAAVGAQAAQYDYNCPLNWQVGSAANGRAFDPLQTDDTIVIGGGGKFVNTFGNQWTAHTVDGMSASAVCSTGDGGGYLLTSSGLVASALVFGDTTCSATLSTSTGGPASCGNLHTIRVPGTVDGTDVVLYTCADGSTSCPNGGRALLVTNASGTAIETTTSFDAANEEWTVEGAKNTIKIGPDGTPSIVASSSGSDGGGGGGGMLIYIIAAVAAVILLAVVIIIFKKSGGGDGTTHSDLHPRQKAAFDNPLYDDAGARVDEEGAYTDIPFGGEGGEEATDGYMDVPVNENVGDVENGALYDDADPPANADDEGGGGYMDVGPDDDEDDDDF